MRVHRELGGAAFEPEGPWYEAGQTRLLGDVVSRLSKDGRAALLATPTADPRAMAREKAGVGIGLADNPEITMMPSQIVSSQPRLRLFLVGDLANF